MLGASPGCSSTAGAPCSAVSSLEAAATSTTPRDTANSIASRSAALVAPPPKLMLIASAPRSVATRIPSTMSSSRMPPVIVVPSLTTARRQAKPAPARPMPLSVPAHARPAVWEPWPSSSIRGAEVPTASALAILPASSGLPPSTPVSRAPTIPPAPVVMSHARGKPCRASAHWIGVPGGTPVVNSVSAVLSAGSLGTRRRSRSHSTETLRTAGSRRRRAIAAAGPRTVATPSRGTPRPARRTPVRASTAPSAEEERGGGGLLERHEVAAGGPGRARGRRRDASGSRQRVPGAAAAAPGVPLRPCPT